MKEGNQFPEILKSLLLDEYKRKLLKNTEEKNIVKEVHTSKPTIAMYDVNYLVEHHNKRVQMRRFGSY